MAKVIREGDALRKECPKCGSLCEFTYSDFRHDDVGHHGDYVVCPACGKHIKLQAIPESWRRLLNREGL
jgi:endogenous inhibitor of DNA gyrase (YacG/DUF329 family)